MFRLMTNAERDPCQNAITKAYCVWDDHYGALAVMRPYLNFDIDCILSALMPRKSIKSVYIDFITKLLFHLSYYVCALNTKRLFTIIDLSSGQPFNCPLMLLTIILEKGDRLDDMPYSNTPVGRPSSISVGSSWASQRSNIRRPATASSCAYLYTLLCASGLDRGLSSMTVYFD